MMSSVAAASLRASAFRRKVSSSSSSIQPTPQKSKRRHPTFEKRAMTNGDVDKKGEEEKEKDAFTSASSNNAQVLQRSLWHPFWSSPLKRSLLERSTRSRRLQLASVSRVVHVYDENVNFVGCPGRDCWFRRLMIISGARKAGSLLPMGTKMVRRHRLSAFSKAGRRARNRERNHIYPSSD